MLRLRRFVVAGAMTSVVGSLFAGVASAETQTFKAVVEFSAIHECTRELVEGETRVHMVITTSENPDGSTHVRVHQRTHGQTLLGAVSGDEYVFNNGEDVISDFRPHRRDGPSRHADGIHPPGRGSRLSRGIARSRRLSSAAHRHVLAAAPPGD
jgi:hypothetical protein